VIELISEKPVIAITINHEHLRIEEVPKVCRQIQDQIGIPAFDVLLDGADDIVTIMKSYLKKHENH
jgi:uncharacterized NAD-dependent epimerase/dehydratase family protein